MKRKVLTEAQVEEFVQLGFTRVEEAFPRQQALAAQELLWLQVEKRGVLRHDRTTWTQPLVQINENYSDPVFQACATERLADAVEDLVGEGRWRTRANRGGWGWWPVNFAKGADRPWTVPTEGWHWDGIHFRHHVDSPEQGLLLLCIFSEVRPRGGGTLVAAGSHQVVARFLRQHPEGLELGQAIRLCREEHPWLAALTSDSSGEVYGDAPGSAAGAAGDANSGGAGERIGDGAGAAGDANSGGAGERTGDGAGAAGDAKAPALARIDPFMNRTHVDSHGTHLRVIETTAAPGDVFLCHPFLFHAASYNHSGEPRFMCNRTTPLIDRLNLHRQAPGEYSVLEQSIRRALG